MTISPLRSDEDSDDEFANYYEKGNEDTHLGVNDDNFLNNGIMGGFRFRVGDDTLDLEAVKVYKMGSDDLPSGW